MNLETLKHTLSLFLKRHSIKFREGKYSPLSFFFRNTFVKRYKVVVRVFERTTLFHFYLGNREVGRRRRRKRRSMGGRHHRQFPRPFPSSSSSGGKSVCGMVKGGREGGEPLALSLPSFLLPLPISAFTNLPYPPTSHKKSVVKTTRQYFFGGEREMSQAHFGESPSLSLSVR